MCNFKKLGFIFEIYFEKFSKMEEEIILPNLSEIYDEFLEALVDPETSCLSGVDFCPDEFPALVNGTVILENLGFEPQNFIRNTWCLLGLAVGFRVLAYLAMDLKFINYHII